MRHRLPLPQGEAALEERVRTMHATFVIDPTTRRELCRSLAVPRSSTWKQLAIRADQLRSDVEHHWTALPDEQRESLKKLAYRFQHDSSSSRVGRAWDWIACRVLRLFPKPNLNRFVVSVVHLSDAVLDAIERENPGHVARVTAAIDEGIRGERVSAPMTGVEFRDWLATKLQDKTAR